MFDKSMRKMPSAALAILLLLLCIFTRMPDVSADAGIMDNPYTNPDTDYEIMIEDRANLLESQDEIIRLQEAMLPITQYGNVVFYTTDNDNDQSVKDRAKYFYETLYLNTSGTIFMIDMYNREIYIFSHGAVE